jgi:hypothetical protein
MIADKAFPRLTPANHRITSPATPRYNCIAWAAADSEHWWQPGVFWPIAVPADDFGIGVLEEAFVGLGFSDCAEANLEPGFEKIAVYGSNEFYTHAARQLPNGAWTSKLGKDVDIEHDTPEAVAGGLYGEVVQFLKRPVRSSP